jgi:hypothetical protein
VRRWSARSQRENGARDGHRFGSRGGAVPGTEGTSPSNACTWGKEICERWRKKRKNPSSARHYDQISFRFHTG